MKKIAALVATCLMVLVCASACGGNTATSSSSASGKPDAKAVSDVMTSSSSAGVQSSSAEAVEPSSSSPVVDNSADMNQVQASITEIAQGSGMNVGTSVIDLTSGMSASYQGSESVVSASMIKLAIAYAFLERVQAGDYSLDEPYVMQSSDIVGGTGTMAGLGAGATVTYGDCLHNMISVSDNTGTNILIRAVGMDAVNATAQSLGLTGTQLNRYMMDSDAMAAGIENYVSADDVAKLLQMVYAGTFVSPTYSSVVMEALLQQQDYGGVLSGLPDGVAFAHKTGTLPTVRHDGGIVLANRPYVLVVLCSGAGFSESGALSVMSQMGSATYACLEG